MMLPLLIRFYVPLVLSALVQYLCIPKTWVLFKRGFLIANVAAVVVVTLIVLLPLMFPVVGG